jgi:malonyl-CoA/methylmalonyl-CoA synthetase
MESCPVSWDSHLPDGVDDIDLLGSVALPRAWARHFEDQPSRSAIGDGREWLTYGELDSRSREVAGRLYRAGIRAGDRIIMSAQASLELVVAYVASQRLGLTVVPANTAYTRREIEHIVGDASPRAAIIDDDSRKSWFPADVLCLGPSVALPSGRASQLDDASSDDIALIAYTSGTTGAPKGAMLSHGNLLASAEALRLAWRWQASDRLVLALPLFHIHGLGVGLNGTLLAGGSAVLLPRFSENGVLEAARDHDASLFFGVPTMYSRLSESPRVGEMANLRLCVSGSAALPAELHTTLSERAGQVVLERYGMTETVMNVSNPYVGERRAGTVGIPLPGVELRLGSNGEIELRGPNVFRGYWRNDDATTEAFTEDGFFRTGDLGRFDEAGYLVINGRAKELIITGGYNVYPREVEDILRTHPAVRDVAVAGKPSSEWGQTVAAWVVASSPVEAAELLDHAARDLAPYKRPRDIEFIDELPRNALGKVQKDRLLGAIERDE